MPTIHKLKIKMNKKKYQKYFNRAICRAARYSALFNLTKTHKSLKPNEQKMEWSSKKLKKRKNARFQRSHPNRTKRSEFVAIWRQTTQNEKNLSKLKGAKYRTARQTALIFGILKHNFQSNKKFSFWSWICKSGDHTQ